MIAAVLQYKFPASAPLRDWKVQSDAAGTRIVHWDAVALGRPQPSAAEIAAWQAAPGFATWQAEHGGNAELTARRKAREILDSALEPLVMVDRVLAEATRDEINLLRQWMMAFKAAVAAATSFANLQTRVAALPNMPDRTKSQLKALAEAKLAAGEVDS